MQKDTVQGVKLLLDTTRKSIYALQNLGIETTHWDVVIIYLVVQRLTKETHQLWEQSLNNSRDIPTYVQLTDFLESRYRTLEVINTDRMPIVRKESSHMNTQKNHRRTNVFHNQQNTVKTSSGSISCCLCSNNHSIRQCEQFQHMTVPERNNVVKENSLCSNCLSSGHRNAKCQSKKLCLTCNQRHHTLLHFYKRPTASNQQELPTTSDGEAPAIQSTNVFHVNHLNTEKILLATAIIKIRSFNGSEMLFRALLDQGSQASFITESAAQKLQLHRHPISAVISGIGNNDVMNAKSQIHFVINAHFQNKAQIPVNALVLKTLTSVLPSTNISKGPWEHVNDLVLADPEFHHPNKIDLLLGADVYANILLDGIKRGPFGSPIAQKTKLGWILSGFTDDQQNNKVSKVSPIVSLTTHVTMDNQLKRFWELESIPEKQLLTEEEKQCEEYYERTVRQGKDGRFIVRLLFKESFKKSNPLGESRSIACARQQQLEHRFTKNPQMKKVYSAVINDYLQQHHMKRLVSHQSAEGQLGTYLPHHVVTKETSSTTKHRVVFNASQPTTSGTSLNECFLVGPPLRETLFFISLRFRKHRIAMTADIEKMYRQIRVADEDVPYQKLVWRHNQIDPLCDYQLLTVTFGTACAPYLAIKTIQHLAKGLKHEFPAASETILRDFYVDDLLSGADSVTEALDLQNQLIQLLKRAGFDLKKWTSNCTQILENVPLSYRETQLPLNLDEDDTIKTLGLYWHPATDCFQFQICLPPITADLTKRKLLSDIAKVFDPNGWLAPVTIKAKIIMQQLWLTGLNWDEKLPDAVRTARSKYRNELPRIENIKVSRWLGTTAKDQILQLHCFCDASTNAYAAVIYLRITTKTGKISTKLLAAKTKVAPIKTVSLPRLELCGAVLGAKLLNKIREAMNFKEIEAFAWTDSMIVLAWLRGHPHKWKTFIANRVVEIHETLSANIWHHVRSEENPADVASRGINPSELQHHPLWWHGPLWLKENPDSWPTQVLPEDTCQEKKKLIVLSVTTNTHMFNLLHRCSTLNKLIRCTAYCLRFIHNSTPPRLPRTKWLTIQELNEATTFWIKLIQSTSFSQEITALNMNTFISAKSKLLTLNPFLDDQGILRVGGRLINSNLNFNSKHPIILPNKNDFTTLIIDYYHILSLHGGPQLMLSLIRARYWILDARNTVRFRIHKCIRCHRQKAEVRSQLMGQLPPSRVTPARPFLRTGVDYAGPFELRQHKGRGAKSYKGYISLFICMSVKAVHLEVVSELTTEGFLTAFRRFTARRGRCAEVFSDNGKNFVGAARTLKKYFQRAQIELEMSEILANDFTDWHFIPPSSPHFGGLWEAGVKSTKYHLKRILGNALLTYEELSTVLTQIEATLNSRPLCPLRDDPNEFDALTPGHFLIGEPLIAIPYPCLVNENVHRLDRWQRLQQLQQGFWKRWQCEYIALLQQRPKWMAQQSNLEKNQMVIIKDESLPPTKWLLGRIEDTHQGSDGLVRVVTIRTKDGLLKRPITKICVLPIEQTTC